MTSKRPRIDPGRLKVWMEDVYARYHDPRFLNSDPLLFVHAYHDPCDQEIAGLIAASLAYGQVVTINKNIARALGGMKPSPHAYLLASKEKDIRDSLSGFRHRWTNEAVMADLLLGVRRVLLEHGSLGALFIKLDRPGAPLERTLAAWVVHVQKQNAMSSKPLLADPSKSSACKRLHLYLRWMIRRDEIDPGCWVGLDPARLLIPLDTHMYQFARACGITQRMMADRKTVEEVTAFFRLVCPEDPVRYDFSLTRLGMIEGLHPDVRMK